MSYVGPIHYGDHRQTPATLSTALKLALALAAVLFVTSLLITAMVAVKLEPGHRGELAMMAP